MSNIKTDEKEYIKINNDIKKAQNGDSYSMEKIFRKYNPLIKNCILRYNNTLLEQDDLMQEAMIGLYKAIVNFDETKGKFSSYAKLCVNRQLITAIKKSNTDKAKILNQALLESEENKKIDQIIGEQSPEQEIIEKEEYNETKNKIYAKLSKKEQKVITLYIKGYNYKEISEITGITKKSIDNTLQRIKRKMKQ